MKRWQLYLSYTVVMLLMGFSVAKAEDSVLTIIDSKGTTHKLSSWSLGMWHQLSILSGIKGIAIYPNSIEQDKKLEKLFKKSGHSTFRSIEVLIPYSQIESMRIVKAPPAYGERGKVMLSTRDGKKEEVSTLFFSIAGKEDLGELGASDYSIDCTKIKEVSFSVQAPENRTSPPQGPYPARVVDLGGKEYVGSDFFSYLTRSNCNYAVHVPCNCGYTGYLSRELQFMKGENTIKLELGRIASMASFEPVTNTTNWSTTVTLASGNVHELTFKPDVDMLVLQDGERYVAIPYGIIRTISFGQK